VAGVALKRQRCHPLSASTDQYLAWKSGTPLPPNPVWENQREQIEHQVGLEVLKSDFDYALISEWKDAETKLTLSGIQSPEHRGLFLRYVSAVFAPRLQQQVSSTQEKHQREQHQREQAQEL
jgi:hypothetical protein